MGAALVECSQAGKLRNEAVRLWGVLGGEDPYARCGSVKRVTIGVGQAMLVLCSSTPLRQLQCATTWARSGSARARFWMHDSAVEVGNRAGKWAVVQ